MRHFLQVFDLQLTLAFEPEIVTPVIRVEENVYTNFVLRFFCSRVRNLWARTEQTGRQTDGRTDGQDS